MLYILDTCSHMSFSVQVFAFSHGLRHAELDFTLLGSACHLQQLAHSRDNRNWSQDDDKRVVISRGWPRLP
jgi:hypothetical protein